MGVYQHVLVASSLINDSKKVGDRAKMIAEKSNATLSIIHVVEFNPMMYGGGEFAIPLDGDLEKSIHDHAKKSLEAEAERLNITENHRHLQSGITTENLVNLINSEKVDLLVLGNHEHHWLAALLGSTANSLVHLMPCDIIAVPL